MTTAPNPFGYVPSFTPQQAPQIPQIPMPQLQNNLQVPSLGSLIQPQQPGQEFNLMAALQQGRDQIESAKRLASQKPNVPARVQPLAPAAETPPTRTPRKSAMQKYRDHRGSR